jgi:prephenate dehydrogenase
MFGPDSAKQGLEGLQVAFCPLTIDAENMDTIKKFWENTGASVEITTPEKHDKDSVYSQAFTYSIAKIILETQLPEITFKTRSFTAITEVARLSSNDSEQLFHDMLYYNPYYPEMKRKLENAITSTLAAMQDIEDDQLMNHLEL